MKLGFIGYGKHARANLYPSLRELGVKISAVSTTHDDSATQASNDYQIPQKYTNHIEMLENEKLDAVFICAKPEQQVQLVKDALNSNVHVFVEKNLGMNSVEAKEILDLSIEKKKNIFVGFMKRFSPIYTQMYEIINNEEFGDIISMSQIFTSRNFVSSSKEYLLFAAIHFIDLIRYYFGEIDVVKGEESVIGDTLSMSFVLKKKDNKTVSLYYSASPSWNNSKHEITITGTNGYVRSFGIDRLVYSSVEANYLQLPKWQVLGEREITMTPMLTTGSGGVKELYLNGFINEIEYFVNNMNKIEINNAYENYQTMKLYDMLVESIN